MTVNPGFGGQAFIPEMLRKVAAVHQMTQALSREVLLSVDGGIDVETAPQVVAQGANVLVAGSAIYGAPEGVAAAVQALRSSLV